METVPAGSGAWSVCSLFGFKTCFCTVLRHSPHQCCLSFKDVTKSQQLLEELTQFELGLLDVGDQRQDWAWGS